MAKWGELALGVSVVLRENVVHVFATVEGDRTGYSRGRNAGNGRELSEDLLLETRDESVVSDIGIGNGDVKSLKLGGLRESGIHVRQNAESANHQAGADQQNQRERDLHGDKDAARAMALTAHAESAVGFGKAGARAGVLEHGEQSEENAC